MNVTQILQRIRDEVDDPLKLKHSDAEVVRHVDEQARGMFRTMIRSNTEWSNMTIALRSADARTLFQNVHEWRLPTWVEKVVRVYDRGVTDATLETTFSAYNFTSDPNKIGREVPKTDPTRRGGWSWDGNHTFRIWNAPQPQDYLLHIAALPPPVFKITIDAAHSTPDDQKLYLPASATLGDLTLGLEEGRYVNAEVEVTGTVDPADTKFGEVRRVTYSTPNALDAGTRRHELTFDYALASVVAVGDQFETRIPVPEIHTRLLVLRAANALAIKMFNVDLQRSLANEMAHESSLFADYAQGPRDSAGPYFKISGVRAASRPYDPDRTVRNWAGY